MLKSGWRKILKRLGKRNSMEFAVNKKIGPTTIDTLRMEPFCVAFVNGWCEDVRSVPPLRLRVNGRALEANEFHRLYRPDVARVLKTGNPFAGFSFEYLLRESLHEARVEIECEGEKVFSRTVTHAVSPPHYSELLRESDVRHREDIYTCGPPAEGVLEEVLQILSFFIPRQYRVLDLGCGRGNVVKFLRDRGVEAFGMEMDRPMIRESLLPQCRDRIALYQGGLPLPYADGEFDAVLAIEVVEHIEDYQGVLREISRIASKRFVMTVPDASAIPRCHSQNVVPWHLLEASHLNFFTEGSLQSLLSPHWRKIAFFKVGHVNVNDASFATSIAAVCDNDPNSF